MHILSGLHSKIVHVFIQSMELPRSKDKKGVERSCTEWHGNKWNISKARYRYLSDRKKELRNKKRHRNLLPFWVSSILLLATIYVE